MTAENLPCEHYCILEDNNMDHTSSWLNPFRSFNVRRRGPPLADSRLIAKENYTGMGTTDSALNKLNHLLDMLAILDCH